MTTTVYSRCDYYDATYHLFETLAVKYDRIKNTYQTLFLKENDKSADLEMFINCHSVRVE